MRLTAIALLILSAAAFADVPKRIEKALEKGEQALVVKHDAKGSELLRALEAAKPHFQRARRLAGKELDAAARNGGPGDADLVKAHADATGRLVAILNAETVIYLDRGSRPLAKKRNGEALELAPKDERALALKESIADPKPYEPDSRIVDSILRREAGKPEARTIADRRILDRRAGSVR